MQHYPFPSAATDYNNDVLRVKLAASEAFNLELSRQIDGLKAIGEPAHVAELKREIADKEYCIREIARVRDDALRDAKTATADRDLSNKERDQALARVGSLEMDVQRLRNCLEVGTGELAVLKEHLRNTNAAHGKCFAEVSLLKAQIAEATMEVQRLRKALVDGTGEFAILKAEHDTGAKRIGRMVEQEEGLRAVIRGLDKQTGLLVRERDAHRDELARAYREIKGLQKAIAEKDAFAAGVSRDLEIARSANGKACEERDAAHRTCNKLSQERDQARKELGESQMSFVARMREIKEVLLPVAGPLGNATVGDYAKAAADAYRAERLESAATLSRMSKLKAERDAAVLHFDVLKARIADLEKNRGMVVGFPAWGVTVQDHRVVLASEIEKLLRDKARMDWVERQSYIISFGPALQTLMVRRETIDTMLAKGA